MVFCFSPLAGEGQLAPSLLSLQNAFVFSAAIPEPTHGLGRDL